MTAGGTLRGAIKGWRNRLDGVRRLGSRTTTGSAPFIDGEFLRKLDRLSLAIGRDLVTGLMGEHLAQRRTSGIEFADYRQYSPGDDLRRVDWNAYARLGALHIRQSQAEHDTKLYLLVDCSPSMNFGEPSKFLTARRIAAAFGYIALAHLDAVVLGVPGAQVGGQGDNREALALGVESADPSHPTPIRGRAEAANLFRYLEQLQPGSQAPFDELLGGWSMRQGTGRIAVLISDLLLDEYRDGARQLVASGFEVTMLHILSPEELRPPAVGDLEVVDSETGQSLEVHLGPESLNEYGRRLTAWLDETRQWCTGQGMRYMLVQSDWDIERLLLETMRLRGVTA